MAAEHCSVQLAAVGHGVCGYCLPNTVIEKSRLLDCGSTALKGTTPLGGYTTLDGCLQAQQQLA